MGKKTSMTRRAFTKLAAATAIAATVSLEGAQALGATAGEKTAVPEVKRIRTACRGCGKMECGVWVTVENGRAVKIEGDESAFQSRGNCCTKSQASLEAAYHPDRLRYPMKRTNPKTDDDPGWMRITWDEAFKTTVAKAQEVQERYGGCSIAGITGTSRVWPMAGTAGWIRMWGLAERHSGLADLQGASPLHGQSRFPIRALLGGDGRPAAGLHRVGRLH